MKTIHSVHNPGVKNIVKLRKSRERKKQGLFLIEGMKEVEAALKSGVDIQSVYVSPDIKTAEIQKLVSTEDKVASVTKEMFKKISYTKEESGILAVASAYQYKLKDLEGLLEDPMVMVLENVEKPGNLGAIIRTAVSAGVDAVIVNDMQTDIFNPNVVRASLGGLFFIKVIEAGAKETYNWLREKELSVYVTSAHSTKSYWNIDYTLGFGLVVGSENRGVSEFWKKKTDSLITIPMKGKVSSLNVSVAGAVVIYEALRQRSRK